MHKFGHVPELLITFGLSYIMLELVQLVWGRQAVNFQPPESLRGPLFTIVDLPDGLGLAWGAAARRCARPTAGAVCTHRSRPSAPSAWWWRVLMLRGACGCC